mmetsp:Transcript_5241/g.7755  ORF Transcript_5241/g.7755 Transcript_5241/m.7755 type:complete len:230 (+) Transcript_5241:2406-3095(+)
MPCSLGTQKSVLRCWRKVVIWPLLTLVPRYMVLRRWPRGSKLPLKPTEGLLRGSWRRWTLPTRRLDVFYNLLLLSLRVRTGLPRRLSRLPWKTLRVPLMITSRRRFSSRILPLKTVPDGTMMTLMMMHPRSMAWLHPWMISTLMMIWVIGVMTWTWAMTWPNPRLSLMKWQISLIWELALDSACQTVDVLQLLAGRRTVLMPLFILPQVELPKRCNFSIDRLLLATLTY